MVGHDLARSVWAPTAEDPVTREPMVLNTESNQCHIRTHMSVQEVHGLTKGMSSFRQPNHYRTVLLRFTSGICPPRVELEKSSLSLPFRLHVSEHSIPDVQNI